MSKVFPYYGIDIQKQNTRRRLHNFTVLSLENYFKNNLTSQAYKQLFKYPSLTKEIPYSLLIDP